MMDAGVEIPVSLDDPAFGLIFGLFLPASRINPLHYLFCGLLGNKGMHYGSSAGQCIVQLASYCVIICVSKG